MMNLFERSTPGTPRIPNRERPAAAKMVPSASLLTAILRNLVSTFPLNSTPRNRWKSQFQLGNPTGTT